VSTGLCVCVAGLLGEDLLQHRRNRAIPVRIVPSPWDETRDVAWGIGTPERAVVRHLERIANDGLLVLVTDGATPALRSHRLAPWLRPGPRSCSCDDARNIDHDRRLAKPAIVATIEEFAHGCAWRWSRSGRRWTVSRLGEPSRPLLSR
jgi:hypothetical protein